VGAPSLVELKARLDGALGRLSWWVAGLCRAGDWIWADFEVPPDHPAIL